MSAPRVTTADVAAAIGGLRPSVVRMCATAPVAEDIWAQALAISKRHPAGDNGGARTRTSHSTHELATIRPHMVHLGLAVKLASGEWLLRADWLMGGKTSRRPAAYQGRFPDALVSGFPSIACCLIGTVALVAPLVMIVDWFASFCRRKLDFANTAHRKGDAPIGNDWSRHPRSYRPRDIQRLFALPSHSLPGGWTSFWWAHHLYAVQPRQARECRISSANGHEQPRPFQFYSNSLRSHAQYDGPLCFSGICKF